MGHKYNVIGHTHTYSTPVCAETHLDACMHEYSYGFCVCFLSHFGFFFYFGTRTDAVALYAQIESLQRTMKEKRKRKTLKPCKRIINLLV